MARSTSAAHNPYEHLPTAKNGNPHNGYYVSQLNNAITRITELTNVTPPPTRTQSVQQTLELMGDPQPHYEKFTAALLANDAQAALEHFTAAHSAKTLSQQAKDHPATAELLTQLEQEHFTQLLNFIRDNLETARQRSNEAMQIFSENFTQHLKGFVLSVQTVTETPERLAAYKECITALPAIQHGQELINLLPVIFDYRYPTRSHRYSTGRKTSADKPETLMSITVDPQASEYFPARIREQYAEITGLRLNQIAQYAAELQAAAKQNEKVSLYWKTPKEHEQEHESFSA